MIEFRSTLVDWNLIERWLAFVGYLDSLWQFHPFPTLDGSVMSTMRLPHQLFSIWTRIYGQRFDTRFIGFRSELKQYWSQVETKGIAQRVRFSTKTPHYRHILKIALQSHIEFTNVMFFTIILPMIVVPIFSLIQFISAVKFEEDEKLKRKLKVAIYCTYSS